MARLRDAPDDLFALTGRASDELRLPLEFVEKDFWITELLRSVARPIDHAYVVFKGGTSLSKAYGLIERFSEDVDVLVVVTRAFDKGFGKGSVDRILKAICSRAGEDLGVAQEDQSLEGAGKGEHRDVRYSFPTRLKETVVRRGVLLEMGVRGSPSPNSPRIIRSLISDYAVRALGFPDTEYEEFLPFDVRVLDPTRTLFEKLAILHHLASTYPDSATELVRAARHLYDVVKLMTSPTVRAALAEHPGLAEALASDIGAVSQTWGWAHTPRPTGGYAVSPAFNGAAPCREAISAGWDAIRPLIYGDVPTLEQCRQAVHEVAQYL